MNTEALPLSSLPEDRPIRLRVTPYGIKLAYYHPTKAIPPFNVNFPREQWDQMVRLVAGLPAGTARFEAYLGFTDQVLALHRIDAVELGVSATGPVTETTAASAPHQEDLCTG